jgi:hypothetical protein
MKKFQIAGLLALVPFVLLTLTQPAQADVSSTSSMLEELKVAQEITTPQYNRAYFKHWIDSDGDGCDTRVEVLQQESLKKVSCSLKGGSWVSMYDGVKSASPSIFDIDHFVPLKEAWESGAAKWDSETRKRFANDLDYQYSLIAVSAKSNRSKSDRDPAEWLPPSQAFLCQYVGRWIAVKYRWSLSVDSNEKAVLVSKLSLCGSKADVEIPSLSTIQKVESFLPTPSPASSPSPTASITPTPTPTPQVSTTPVPSVPQPSRVLDPKFSSCAEAKRNGYTRKYFKGIDPEYYYYRDGDGDGVVCE